MVAIFGDQRAESMRQIARVLRLRFDERKPAKFNPAAALGMTVGALHDPFDFTRRYDWLFPFDRGSSQIASNVAHGDRAGRRTFLFDWQFRSGPQKLLCSVVLTETEYRFQDLWVRPHAGAWDVQGAPKSGIRVEVQGFHDRYMAQGESPHQGERILHEDCARYLVDRPDAWFIFSRHVVVAILVPPGVSNTAGCMAEALGTAEGIMARMPDALKHELAMAKKLHKETMRYG